MIDTITFIEEYCLINDKHIKLKDYQKKFIKWLEKNIIKGGRMELKNA